MQELKFEQVEDVNGGSPKIIFAYAVFRHVAIKYSKKNAKEAGVGAASGAAGVAGAELASEE